MKKRTFRIVLIGIALFIGFMILKDSFTQRGIKDLPGGFEEVAFVRNEQNKGGIIRIYAFSVEYPERADYHACGDLLPYNEYGSATIAYFFKKGEPMPKHLVIDSPHFEASAFSPIATYTKRSGGIATVN